MSKKVKKNLTYDLVKYPNTKLSQVCKKADLSDLKKITKIANKLIATCKKFEGLGLAAPQAGLNVRMFVAELGDDALEVIINPKIINMSDDVMFELESCLSLEGQYNVKRPWKINVEYYTLRSGDIIRILGTLEGFYCRVFMHELDHLEGIIIKDIGKKV